MKKTICLLFGIVLISCLGKPHMQSGLSYPDMISPIYFLDTFRIQDPVVVFIESQPYITSEAILKDSLDKTDLRERKGVIRYLTEDLTTNKTWDYIKIYNASKKTDRKSLYSLQHINEFLYIEDNLKLFNTIGGTAIYRFDIEPQSFLLTLITKKDSLITSYGNNGDLANDVILGVDYSNDYMLAMAPLFSSKNRKILNQRHVDNHLKE